MASQHQPFSLRSSSHQPQDETDKYIEYLRQKKQDEEQVRIQNDQKNKKSSEQSLKEQRKLQSQQELKNKKITYDFDGKVIVQSDNKTKLPENYANMNFKVSTEKEVKQYQKIPNFVQKVASQRRQSDLQSTPSKIIKQQSSDNNNKNNTKLTQDDNFYNKKKTTQQNENQNGVGGQQQQDSVSQATLMFQHLKLSNGVSYKDNIGNNKSSSDAKLQLALQAALEPTSSKKQQYSNNQDPQQQQQPIRMSKSEYNELLTRFGRFSRIPQNNSNTYTKQPSTSTYSNVMKENKDISNNDQRLRMYQQQFGEVTQITVKNGLTENQQQKKNNTLQLTQSSVNNNYNDNFGRENTENQQESYGYLRQNQKLNMKQYEKQSSMPASFNSNKPLIKNNQLPKLNNDNQIKVNSQAMLNMLLE